MLNKLSVVAAKRNLFIICTLKGMVVPHFSSQPSSIRLYFEVEGGGHVNMFAIMDLTVVMNSTLLRKLNIIPP